MKVTRLGSGRDSSRLSMQLSFATLSERAAWKEHEKSKSNQSSCLCICVVGAPDKAKWFNIKTVTDRCLQQSWDTAHQ